MKKLNNLFIILILMMGLLSIAYIWKSQETQKSLETEINQQSTKIDSLKNKVTELEKNKDDIENGDVKGATTTLTGTVMGIVEFSDLAIANTTIVCAQDKFTIKEFCTDELIKTDDQKKFQYTLEIPKSKYFIYAMTPPDTEKNYYSKIQKCTNDDSCENNQKIILEVLVDETQNDVNIYF